MVKKRIRRIPKPLPSYSEIVRFYLKEKWKDDEKITNELKRLGYTVLRFWGEEINKDIEKCLKKIQKTIKE